VYAPIAVSTWKAGTPRAELPAVEITDEVPRTSATPPSSTRFELA